MSFTEVSISRKLIELDPGSFDRILTPGQELQDTYTRELLDQCIDRALSVMEPRGGYVRFPKLETGSEDGIAIEGTRFSTGRTIGKLMRNAESFVFFAVTAGAGPEGLSAELIRSGQYPEGFMVDMVASAIAESVAGLLHDHIRELALEEGNKITNRYSPGYCGWEVTEQQKVFGILPAEPCGITLSESSLMNPIKSVSGMIGIGKEVAFRDYTCELCAMKDCLYRTTAP